MFLSNVEFRLHQLIVYTWLHYRRCLNALMESYISHIWKHDWRKIDEKISPWIIKNSRKKTLIFIFIFPVTITPANADPSCNSLDLWYVRVLDQYFYLVHYFCNLHNILYLKSLEKNQLSDSNNVAVYPIRCLTHSRRGSRLQTSLQNACCAGWRLETLLQSAAGPGKWVQTSLCCHSPVPSAVLWRHFQLVNSVAPTLHPTNQILQNMLAMNM